MSHLSVRVPLAKSKISELLRGLGHYPRWEIIFSLSVPLEVPSWPLYRLWRQAALEARKSPDWVEQSSDRIPVTTAQTPPLDHRAFQETVETMYRLYAQVFLDDDQRDTAVSNTFDILWLSWNDALASPDIRRFAWQALRATVMSVPRTLMDGPSSGPRRSTRSRCGSCPPRRPRCIRWRRACSCSRP
ncbi:hypothetical protein ACFQ60_01990 [Streptomyces zhihengii]